LADDVCCIQSASQSDFHDSDIKLLTLEDFESCGCQKLELGSPNTLPMVSLEDRSFDFVEDGERDGLLVNDYAVPAIYQVRTSEPSMSEIALETAVFVKEEPLLTGLRFVIGI